MSIIGASSCLNACGVIPPQMSTSGFQMILMVIVILIMIQRC